MLSSVNRSFFPVSIIPAFFLSHAAAQETPVESCTDEQKPKQVRSRFRSLFRGDYSRTGRMPMEVSIASKRAGVISGPGSVMSGSNASLAITILTKDADDVNGHRISSDPATEDRHRQVNFLSGRKFSGGEYMFPATYAMNDGVGPERADLKNHAFDFDSIPRNDQRGSFNHMHHGYEIYGKLNYRQPGFSPEETDRIQYPRRTGLCNKPSDTKSMV